MTLNRPISFEQPRFCPPPSRVDDPRTQGQFTIPSQSDPTDAATPTPTSRKRSTAHASGHGVAAARVRRRGTTIADLRTRYVIFDPWRSGKAGAQESRGA